MLDNVADLLLAVSLLAVGFGFPTTFALRYMIPGTAVGVLVGDALFFLMALRLARRTGRNDITAMPLGLDTPSTFGMVFFVLGPAFLSAKASLGLADGVEPTEKQLSCAAMFAWQVGICSIVLSGVFKSVCSLGSNWIRRVVPRAGLLGSLTAIALVLICFLPLLEILHFPIVGFAALAIILTTLVAKVRLPGHIPGALGALLVAGAIYYLMYWTGTLVDVALLEPAAETGRRTIDPAAALLPHEWLQAFRFQWVGSLRDSLQYLPIVIPFALATVVGGIDCVESAAAAGDEYDTRRIIGVEALATLAAGLCGGVIQTTPYIGHPAYKAMGGRAAYVLATALFVGGAGLLGYFGYLYLVIPKAAVFPILVFIGLEITAQSFHATPKRHYAAVALACVPALAALALMFVDQILGDPIIRGQGLAAEDLGAELQAKLLVLRTLAGGFIVTSLLWASMLAAIIDRRLALAAGYCAIAAACSLFGVIHSPLPGSPMSLPWQISGTMSAVPIHYCAGYLTMSALLAVWAYWMRRTDLQTNFFEKEIP